jgi:hypothetical protein
VLDIEMLTIMNQKALEGFGGKWEGKRQFLGTKSVASFPWHGWACDAAGVSRCESRRLRVTCRDRA